MSADNFWDSIAVLNVSVLGTVDEHRYPEFRVNYINTRVTHRETRRKFTALYETLMREIDFYLFAMLVCRELYTYFIRRAIKRVGESLYLFCGETKPIATTLTFAREKGKYMKCQ